MKRRLFLLVLILSWRVTAAVADPAGILRGTWTASAGGQQAFGGGWSAEISTETPDIAIGSWTLVGERGQVLLQGTWSTRKLARRWQGTWAARTATGRLYRGAWQADARNLTGKTFRDMLAQTAEKQISGTWRSGAAQGRWWLKGN
jgi:hypothetical protein